MPIELIAFSEEEGVRFGVPFLGSRALTGVFDHSVLEYADADGIRMDQAIRDFGLDPGRIDEAALDGNVRGFIEIHIEQGTFLEAKQIQLGVVSNIVVQTRLGLRFRKANHVSTTPMHAPRRTAA